MDTKLQKKLFDKFEFLRKSVESNKKCKIKNPFQLFAVETGDGWFKLLEDLCSKISKEIKKDKIKDFSVAQIKEKFGGLRFYISGGNEKIYNLIDKAERDSYKICEDCGKPGKCIDTGWVYTACKKHGVPLIDKAIKQIKEKIYTKDLSEKRKILTYCFNYEKEIDFNKISEKEVENFWLLYIKQGNKRIKGYENLIKSYAKKKKEKIKLIVSPLKMKNGYADGGKVTGVKLPKNWGKVNGEKF